MGEKNLAISGLPCSACGRSEICGSQRATWKVWIEKELVKPTKNKGKKVSVEGEIGESGLVCQSE